MAEKYMFFNSTATDRRRHQASDLADYWQSFLNTGLINENTSLGLQVIADNDNMKIEVTPGRALICGHLYINDETLTLDVDGATASLNRIDRVVLRFDNSIDKRYIRAFVKKGQMAEHPVPPTLTRNKTIYELSLAQIYIPAGKSFVEQSDVTDERLNEDVCGLATALGHVPTDVFKEQWELFEAEYNRWFADIQSESFATVEDVRAVDNDLKREVANLNLQLEAAQRVPQGKTFGTNFDTAFGMQIDTARTSCESELPVAATQITVKDASEFVEGTEVTIYDDVNLERIKISSISGNIITLQSATTKAYKEGVNIARSMSVIDAVNKNLSFGVWGTYKYENADWRTTTVTSSTYANKGKNLARLGAFWYVATNTKLIKIDDNNNVSDVLVYADIISGSNVTPTLETATNHILLLLTQGSSTNIIVIDRDNNVITNKLTIAHQAHGYSMDDGLLVGYNTTSLSFEFTQYAKNGSLTTLGSVTVASVTTSLPHTTFAHLNVLADDTHYHVIHDSTGVNLVHLKVKRDFSAHTHTNVITDGTNANKYSYPHAIKMPNGKIRIAVAYNTRIKVFESTDASTFTQVHNLTTTGTAHANDGTSRPTLFPFITKNGDIFAVTTRDSTNANWVLFKHIPTTSTTAMTEVVRRGSTNFYIGGYPSFWYKDGEYTRPFYSVILSATLYLDGSGVVGYGNELTANDIRFKTQPTKEIALWLQHDNELTVSEAKFGTLPMDKEAVDGETQFTSVSALHEHNEVRFTITRQAVDDDVKITKILGGIG